GRRAGHSRPSAAPLRPLGQKWRRDRFPPCPKLGLPSGVFPSNPAAFGPFGVRVPRCKSCSRRLGQLRTALLLRARLGTTLHIPFGEFVRPFVRFPTSPPEPRWR